MKNRLREIYITGISLIIFSFISCAPYGKKIEFTGEIQSSSVDEKIIKKNNDYFFIAHVVFLETGDAHRKINIKYLYKIEPREINDFVLDKEYYLNGDFNIGNIYRIEAEWNGFEYEEIINSNLDLNIVKWK